MRLHHVIFLSSVLIGCSVHAPDAQTSAPLSGTGTPIVSGVGGKCLDDKADSTANDNEIDLYACNGTAAQRWTYTNDTFVGPGGKCLDIKADAQVPGTVVDLYQCNGTNAQKWTVTGTSIKSTAGLCLDVENGTNANGTQIELATCNGSAAQVWNVGAATTSGLPQKSIGEFVDCSSTADQYAGVQAAFRAAENDAFELVVDCPVTIHTARLPNKTVFIGNGTTVSFTSAGLFYVDNVLQPAFAIMNSSNIKLLDWNIVYTGSLGVALPDNTGNKFNDETATAWLAANRFIDFNGQHSGWQDTYNTGGLFFIVGEDSNILFSGTHITAATVVDAKGASPLPVSAPAGFVPCVFTFGDNWKSGTSAAKPNVLSAGEVRTTANTAGPMALTFENITLDGTIMGFVGGGISDVTFTNITSIHYSDVQDAAGNHIGGVVDPSNNGPWTPPPHLFYLVNDTLTKPAIVNQNLSFTNIQDATVDSEGRAITYDRTHRTNPDRVGGPRDTAAILKAADRPQSGYALSIKLMCGVSAATEQEGVNGGCILDNYKSYRPDGFLAVSDLNNVLVESSTATFDSNYTDGLPMYRPGVWFPGGYTNLTFKNVTFTDVAATPRAEPIGYSEGFSGLLFEDINAEAESTGVFVYVNALPANGVHLDDDNVGQSAGSARYYVVGNDKPIKVTP